MEADNSSHMTDTMGENTSVCFQKTGPIYDDAFLSLNSQFTAFWRFQVFIYTWDDTQVTYEALSAFCSWYKSHIECD